MKIVGLTLGSIALLLSILIPPLIVVTCPIGALALLVFVRATRKEREALAERRHHEMMDAARFR